MSRFHFTRRQWLVLAVMAAAVVLVFGLLSYSVIITLNSATPVSPDPSPSLPIASPTATLSPTVTVPPTPAPSATPPEPLSPVQSARVVHEVGRIVAQVRELPPVAQIAVTFPTEHEVALSLLQQYQEEQPQAALWQYVVLGLFPAADIDPPPLPDVAAQAAHISSLYLPASQEILVVAGRGATSEDEQALAHALAHALQDRAFELPSLTPCQSTTDAQLALQALVEGDAVLAAAHYTGVASDLDELEKLARLAARAERPTYAALADNAVFERLLLFDQWEGGHYAQALFEEDAWEAVNRAYVRPPCSTEHILHPAKYLMEEPVQQVAMPGLDTVLGADWELVWRDTLGEFLIGLHLMAHLDEASIAWEAAEGWAGDTFVLWENTQGEQVVAWRVAWDDREEAAAFERAYTLVAPHLTIPPHIAVEPPFDLPGRFWEGPAGAAYLARTGRMISIVWGPDLETVAAIAQTLP